MRAQRGLSYCRVHVVVLLTLQMCAVKSSAQKAVMEREAGTFPGLLKNTNGVIESSCVRVSGICEEISLFLISSNHNQTTKEEISVSDSWNQKLFPLI